MHRIRLAAILTTLTLFSGFVSASEIHRCRSADGDVSYVATPLSGQTCDRIRANISPDPVAPPAPAAPASFETDTGAIIPVGSKIAPPKSLPPKSLPPLPPAMVKPKKDSPSA